MRKIDFLKISLMFATLIGCESTINARGNNLFFENMQQFKVGKTTAQEIVDICGSPSLQQDNLNWIYIKAESEDIAFRKVEVKNQSVVKLRFNRNGILESMEEVPQANEINLPFDEDITPLPTSVSKK